MLVPALWVVEHLDVVDHVLSSVLSVRMGAPWERSVRIIARQWRAIWRSSWLETTQTRTLLCFVEILPPCNWLIGSSIKMPRKWRPWQTLLRIRALCSPMPPGRGRAETGGARIVVHSRCGPVRPRAVHRPSGGQPRRRRERPRSRRAVRCVGVVCNEYALGNVRCGAGALCGRGAASSWRTGPDERAAT